MSMQDKINTQINNFLEKIPSKTFENRVVRARSCFRLNKLLVDYFNDILDRSAIHYEDSVRKAKTQHCLLVTAKLIEQIVKNFDLSAPLYAKLDPAYTIICMGILAQKITLNYDETIDNLETLEFLKYYCEENPEISEIISPRVDLNKIEAILIKQVEF